MVVRVAANPRTTARYEWDDEVAEEIRDFFFDQGALPQDSLVNGEDIEALAKAAAARVYSTMLDRNSGAATFPAVTSKPRVVGSMQSVSTSADINGLIVTRYQFGAELRPREIADYLPTEIRSRVVGDLR